MSKHLRDRQVFESAIEVDQVGQIIIKEGMIRLNVGSYIATSAEKINENIDVRREIAQNLGKELKLASYIIQRGTHWLKELVYFQFH